jgi:cellulose synthase/poly-beta-1,6-N-acetylglucosamine synthase-like glycosyltransferase
VVNCDPDQTGILLGNLRIAEDRVLTLKTEHRRKMGLVPEAIFYFEAELKLKQLVLQRRRWINGSLAGYIYLITNPGLLFRVYVYIIS